MGGASVLVGAPWGCWLLLLLTVQNRGHPDYVSSVVGEKVIHTIINHYS